MSGAADETTTEAEAAEGDAQSPEALEAEIERIKGAIAAADEGRAAAERSLTRQRLARVLVQALAQRNCSNPEAAAAIVTAEGRLGIDEKDALCVTDPGDLDPDLVLNDFRARVPELFRGPASARAPAAKPAGPPLSKYDQWRSDLGRVR